MRRALLLLILASCGRSSLIIPMVQQNNSGQDGTATLTDTSDGLELLVAIARSTFEGSQTSHIHYGRCDNVGGIVGGITPISDKSETPDLDGGVIFFKAIKADKKLADFRGGNFVINVHDARDNSLYVSCGEID